MKKTRGKRLRIIAISLIAVFAVFCLVLFFITRISNGVASLHEGTQLNILSEPILSQEVITTAKKPTTVSFVNQELMLIGQKDGDITAHVITTGESWSLGTVPEITTEGERGLQSIEVDREFFDNRYVYVCYSASSPDRGMETRVSRFKLSSDFKSLSSRLDIVTGITNAQPRNQGCELAMDRLGNLWVATADSGSSSAAQDPKSLAGKVLRVLRDGNPSSGNQALPFDPRIYSYGHRNPSGITLLESPLLNGSYGYIAERGGVQDDEVNELVMGNFGWDPNNQGSYNNAAPMTDLAKYNNAIRSLWSSGKPLNGVGNIERLGRKRWQAWQGQLVLTGTRPNSSLLIQLADDGSYKSEKPIFPEYPSLGIVLEAPDGSLILGTANADGNDQIIRVQVLCTVCD